MNAAFLFGALSLWGLAGLVGTVRVALADESASIAVSPTGAGVEDPPGSSQGGDPPVASPWPDPSAASSLNVLPPISGEPGGVESTAPSDGPDRPAAWDGIPSGAEDSRQDSAALVGGGAGSLADEPGLQDPASRLNYASILFYKARRLMATGQGAAAGATFRLVEAALLEALALADRIPEERARAMLESQSAFLLGDLNAYVFNDPEKAKALYREAVRFFPEHDGALEALKRFE